MSKEYQFNSDNLEICQYCQEEYANPAYTNVREDVVLCNFCANKFMNVVHKAQYGRYFSWPEELPVEPRGYTKKKIGMTLRMSVYERDGFKCVTCGVQKNLTCDHIKPESLGGETTLLNLQTMCKSCNSSKGVKYAN